MFGPAAAPSAVLEIAKHLLAHVVPRPRLPDGAVAWEHLWSSTPLDQLPWTHDAIDPPLARALDAQAKPGRRLLELGTGTGIVAIAAAQRGYRVTATEISATALGRARTAAGDQPILFALDDVLASHLDATFDVVVDRGVLHCLPPDRRAAYAAAVTARTAFGGTLLVVAHTGAELATHPITAAELATLLPAFTLVSSTATTLSGGAASLIELRRV